MFKGKAYVDNIIVKWFHEEEDEYPGKIWNPNEVCEKEILPQSSGEFDPEGDPELEKLPDPSETIRRNFRKHCI